MAGTLAPLLAAFNVTDQSCSETGRVGSPAAANAAFACAIADFAEMEDRRGQHGAGMAVASRHPPDPATLPTPPEAITGTGTASDTARVSARS